MNAVTAGFGQTGSNRPIRKRLRIQGNAMTETPGKTMTPLEWGMLLVLSLFWGGSFFFVGVAVKELPPLTIVALRVSLAAAILWACLPGARRRRAEAARGAGRLSRHGPSQQRHSGHADRVRPETDRERPRFDPPRDH